MYKKNLSDLRVVMYVRKSSESEDRQVQSIADQKSDLAKLVAENNLNIIEVFEESVSGKAPGRPQFSLMMEMFYTGKADAIIAWHTNRLSRNAKDSGEVQHLLITDKIKAIITMQRTYFPEDNALLLSVETGMSTQFITDLRNATNRGLRSKAENGWMPNRPPIGWMNDKDTHQIIVDDQDNRFTIVRNMWDMMLSGNYSVPQVWKKSIEWGLRTKTYRHSGNKHLSLSNCYRLFDDPFYFGIFRWKEKLWQGKHKPMITQEEFERVQSIIKKKVQKPKLKDNSFGYSGKIFCGECGCMCTAEYKKKIIKKTKEERWYRLYRCTRKRYHLKCSQKRYLNQNDIDDQIVEEMKKYSINEKVRDWCVDVLKTQHEQITDHKQNIYESQQKDLSKIELELDNLGRMLYRQQIDEVFYNKEKTDLESKKLKLRGNIDNTETFADDWREVSERAFNFLTTASEVLKNASQEDKKTILSAIAQSVTARDKKLTIIPHEWITLVRTLNENLKESEVQVRTSESLTEQAEIAISENFPLMLPE